MRSRLYRIAFARGGAIVAASLLLYLWLAPAYTVGGDNAEFAAIGARGGVPHPSGYPLYILWLRLMSWLPGSTPAHTTALATAILAAISLAILHAACRAWGASAPAATFAVGIYAVAPVVLRLHTEAEVFALNGLIVSAVLWLAADGGPARGTWRAVLLALVGGLGLANHMTCALVAPVGVLGMVRAFRESPLARVELGAAAAGAFVVGLLPYLYLLIPPPSDISWGHPDSLGALVRHVLRFDYGGPGKLSANAESVPAMVNLGALAHTLAAGWLYLLLAVGLGALLAGVVRPRWLYGEAGRGEPRATWIALAASWLLAGPILIARFNISPRGINAYVCERFHMLPTLLLAIPVAIGLDLLARALAPYVRGQLLRSIPVLAVISIVAEAAAAAPSLAHIAKLHSPAGERAIENTLSSLPPNAVMITVSDELCFGIGYVQTVLGMRPDVTPITWSLVKLGWYRDRIARHGLVMRQDPDEAASVALAREAFAQGRPVFIDHFESTIAAAFPTYPYGILFRVLPPDAKAPSLEEVVDINRALFAHFDLAYPKPGPDEGFATEVHQDYADTWNLFASALARSGKLDDAGWAQGLARQLAPTPE